MRLFIGTGFIILMRLFVACGMPDGIRQKLAALQNDIGNEHARIKWVEPVNIHLTMKFLGDVKDSRVDSIRKSLRKIRFKPFISSVSGFGAFPSESYVKVLWVGLKPKERLEELHARIDGSMSELGFRKDPRFQPHVTLGRVRFVNDKNEFLRKIRELKDTGIGEPFKTDSFRLVKSTLTRSGPVYEDIEVFGSSSVR